MNWLVSTAALLAIGLLGAVVLLQLLLALGLPLGGAAWGGRHRTLPRRLRVASGIAAGVLVIAMWLVATEAGFLPAGVGTPGSGILVWVFAGFFALNTLGNLVSESVVERRLMAPITIYLALSFALLALFGK